MAQNPKGQTRHAVIMSELNLITLDSFEHLDRIHRELTEETG